MLHVGRVVSTAMRSMYCYNEQRSTSIGRKSFISAMIRFQQHILQVEITLLQESLYDTKLTDNDNPPWLCARPETGTHNVVREEISKMAEAGGSIAGFQCHAIQNRSK